MNTTPRTDAFIGDHAEVALTEVELARCEFARILERELAEIKEVLWPDQTGLPNDHRNAAIAVAAIKRLSAERIAEKDAQIVALRSALSFIHDECDWEESGIDYENGGTRDGGDRRIGPACVQALSAPPPSVVPLEYVHSLLDGPPAQIIRNAKGGYPEGRENRVLSIEERIAALKCFASDYKRWLEELEELTGRKHP